MDVSEMLLLTPTVPLSGEQKWKVTPEFTHGLLFRGQWRCKERMVQGTQHDRAGEQEQSPGTYSSFQGLFHVRKGGGHWRPGKRDSCLYFLTIIQGLGLPWLVPKWLPFFRALFFSVFHLKNDFTLNFKLCAHACSACGDQKRASQSWSCPTWCQKSNSGLLANFTSI